MNSTTFYTDYCWRVIKNNRFVGYVVSFSQFDAIRKATEKYGRDVWVERLLVSPNPTDLL